MCGGADFSRPTKDRFVCNIQSHADFVWPHSEPDQAGPKQVVGADHMIRETHRSALLGRDRADHRMKRSEAEFGRIQLRHRVVNVENDPCATQLGSEGGKDHEVGKGVHMDDIRSGSARKLKRGLSQKLTVAGEIAPRLPAAIANDRDLMNVHAIASIPPPVSRRIGLNFVTPFR